MLLKSLSQTKSDKMQAITATIQKEQNTVIRYPDVQVLLVNGIAGSGKTSVLLQRIAYLFYQKRKTLRRACGVGLYFDFVFYKKLRTIS